MSTFALIGHNEKQRRQILEAIDLFREKDTRDELGISVIRDAFADMTLIEDLDACAITRRSTAGFRYPILTERLPQLKLNWVTIEELLEPTYGTDFDIAGRPNQVTQLAALVREIASRTSTDASLDLDADMTRRPLRNEDHDPESLG